MAEIFQQYDPNWAAFQKAYESSNPLVETAAEKADQAKLDAFVQGVSDPSSPNYRHYVGNVQAAFPGAQQWIQDQMAYNKAMADAFQQKYGHSYITGTTISGPPMMPKATTQSVTPPATTPNVMVPMTTPPNPQPAAVTPPTTSTLNLNPLVTAPGTSTISNPVLGLPAGVNPGGALKLPDLLKQTQQRWGFGPKR